MVTISQSVALSQERWLAYIQPTSPCHRSNEPLFSIIPACGYNDLLLIRGRGRASALDKGALSTWWGRFANHVQMREVEIVLARSQIKHADGDLAVSSAPAVSKQPNLSSRTLPVVFTFALILNHKIRCAIHLVGPILRAASYTP